MNKWERTSGLTNLMDRFQWNYFFGWESTSPRKITHTSPVPTGPPGNLPVCHRPSPPLCGRQLANGLCMFKASVPPVKLRNMWRRFSKMDDHSTGLCPAIPINRNEALKNTYWPFLLETQRIYSLSVFGQLGDDFFLFIKTFKLDNTIYINIQYKNIF